MDPQEKVLLVYFCIGKQTALYQKTIFSILSYFCLHPSLEKVEVLVYTDREDLFQNSLIHLPISYFLLEESEIRKMKGSIDFIHRVKIGVIEKAIALGANKILYVDSDTFFFRSIESLLPQITKDQAVMHTFEYPIAYLASFESNDPHRRFYEMVEQEPVSLSGVTKVLHSNFNSYNAGVIGLHSTHQRFLKEVYELTDQFYPLSHSHASEQYAFSYVIQNHANMVLADGFVYHYWHRVHKDIADIYIHKVLNKTGKELEKETKKLIVRLPHLFKTHRLQMEYQCMEGFWLGNRKTAYFYLFKALCKGSFARKKFMKDVGYHILLQIKN